MADHYQTLGVARGASKTDIKKAFHKLAAKHHPDRNPNASEKDKARFKEINAAYSTLSDDQKRANYDKFGTDNPGQGGGWSGGGDFSSFSKNFKAGGFGSSSFSDIFNDFFGGGSTSAQSGQRGADTQIGISITLEKAFSGVEQEIDFQRIAQCEDCSGSGASSSSKKKICRYCNGQGVISDQRGFFTFQQDCPHCMGYGEQNSIPCSTCSGQGRIKKREKIRFSIPAGILDGAPIKIAGKGEAGHGENSPSGDLYIFVKILDHSQFTRDKDHLRMELEVPFWDAALGGSHLIHTLDKKTISLKIPPCTQNGKIFRLPKKGMPSNQMFRSAGDLYVKVNVQIPSKLTKEQEKLLRRVKEIGAAGGN